MDWSQPVGKLEDDELKLDWGGDKEDDEDDDEDCLTMKKLATAMKAEGPLESKLQRDDSQVGQVPSQFSQRGRHFSDLNE